VTTLAFSLWITRGFTVAVAIGAGISFVRIWRETR
jgi:hypothetical protein